jgi:hypothetical protein
MAKSGPRSIWGSDMKKKNGKKKATESLSCGLTMDRVDDAVALAIKYTEGRSREHCELLERLFKPNEEEQ